MFRTSMALLLLAAVCATPSRPFAQGTAAPASQATAGRTPPTVPPLFFREDWSGKSAPRDCVNLHDARCEVALTQEFVSNPNLELQIYGGGKPRIEHGEWLGAVLVQRDHLFTGMTEQPFAIAFRDKSNYVDLSGLAKIRWAAVRASGLHFVHFIIKLADGTWLLSEQGYGSNQLQVRPVDSPSLTLRSAG